MPPNVRRPSQVDNAIPEDQTDEPSGVYGELPDRIEERIRRQTATLTGIRSDFTKHAELDEKSFGEVKSNGARLEGTVSRLEGTVATLSGQHASTLVEIGGIKGSLGLVSGQVTTLLTLQQEQIKAQLEAVATARRQLELAEADKRTERTDTAKVALAKTEANKTIWLKLIAALIVIAGIITAAMAGHAVK